MPTYQATERFLNDFKSLKPAEKRAFLLARDKFMAALRANPNNPSFPKDLRVKPVQGAPRVWEMSWDWPNGRATWSYGDAVRPGEIHILWRRCGGHEIFKKPFGTEQTG